MSFSKLLIIVVSVAVSISALAAPGPDVVEARAEAAGHTGDGTFYTPGLGACGITNTVNDLVVAVGHDLYDTFPGHTTNPNNNPVCKKKIKATFNGKSVTVDVRDRCTRCARDDLDFSPAAFDKLANRSVGRIHGVQWDFV